MLDALNDDCQLAIIKYLNLNEQIALYEATKGTSNRLNENVAYAWKLQLSFILDWRDYKKFEVMPELLDVFLSNCSATMQNLNLDRVKLNFLKRWENYTFPRMKTLEYTLDFGDDYTFLFGAVNEVAEEAIRTMAKLFPGLHSLKTDGDFHCVVLQKWKQMRKLELSNWYYHDYEYDCVKDIAKCQLLEELTLDHCRIKSSNYDDLMALPKLHKLCLLSASEVKLAELFEKRAVDVHRIIFSNDHPNRLMTTLSKMRNVRHFNIMDIQNHFDTEDLRDLIKIWKQLEQIDLISLHIWSGEAELWQTVASCPTLKILNILNTDMREDFFEVGRRIMEETLNNRSQTLTLNFYHTYYKKLIIQNFKHPQLKVSFEPFKLYDDDDINFVEIHFQPLQSS
ncbi:uncharacterized protein LOC133841297 isoform X1 [Drosophila sulfurigaster albostrigata]|uniref:uncharacterized protein LOC133841297 isoform X1 n=1 Tax=Drosophila sulfurigaster albostrigata TaxID=89887 RepID=UPI002D21A6A6|nr:uncharacterized protein LOC133841297 isoform X1 [Drosophila sulfurigaster albostrigata]